MNATCLPWGDACIDPLLDDDNDGLSNQQEIDLGTNPQAPDTDEDGLIDSFEAGSVSAPTDTDDDGIIDALESRLDDADCDGISDQEDPVRDPLRDGVSRLDSDGDGTLDTCVFDTDGDGLTDHLDCEPEDADVTDTCPPGPLCTLPVCVPGVGCDAEPVVCNDDDLCTTDKCNESTGDCDFIDVDCDSAPCSTSVCDPLTGACVFSELDCVDDHLCTTDEYCDVATGECVFKVKDCDDGDPCTTDACNPDSGSCQYAPAPCDDGDPCTTDKCASDTGECISTTGKCDDHSPCSTDTCDPVTGACTHVQTDCDDGDACTIDLCDTATGDCLYEPKDCTDDDPCTDATCDPQSGWCDHPPINCNDFDACTTDSCLSDTGECIHEGITCSDALPCTDDGCLPSSGCTYTPTVCDDGDPCTTGACHPEDGKCQHTTVQCDDGNPCTVDTCNADFGGVCTFEAASCDDGDPCTQDACEPDTGDCVHTAQPPVVMSIGPAEDTTTGLALWNASVDSPEGAGTGHALTTCGDESSPYFLSSAQHADIVPGSAGLGAALSATSLQDFEAHIATLGLDITALGLRLSLSTLGNDEEGADWSFDTETAIETRHYQGATLEVWLEDTPLLTSNIGTLTATVDHSTCGPQPRPMTLESDWSYVVALTQAATPAIQLAAQLLLQALGVPAQNRLELTITPDDVTPLQAEGRTGHVIHSVTGTLTGVTCESP